MTYELALRLKNAGFPDSANWRMEVDTIWDTPTLEELIETCGKRFWMLEARNIKEGNWNACGYSKEKIESAYGSTPTIAVANLWLALNAK